MENQEQIYIYGLLDPITRNFKYVGATRDIIRRNTQPPGKWLYSKGNTAKNRWIQCLAASGLRPEIVQLEVTTKERWIFRRKEWVGRFKSRGFPLLNADKSQRCREASLRLWQTPEFRVRVNLGRFISNRTATNPNVGKIDNLPALITSTVKA
jgi:hypothetical protein